MILTNPHSAHLMRAFEIAGIEYGRADFGFRDGRIQIFEINTNPFVSAPPSHNSRVRVENMQLAWEKYLDALAAIDSPSGPPFSARGGRLPQEIRDLMNQDIFEMEARRRNTRKAERIIKAQGEEIEKLRLQLEVLSAEKRYALGEILDFSSGGSAGHFTGTGWSAPEPWGTWTDGAVSRLSLLLEAVPEAGARLVMDARALVLPSHSTQRVTVTMCGKVLGTHVFTSPEFERVTFAAPAGTIPGMRCEIAFSLPDAISLKAVGSSEDDRLLALGFRSLQIVETPQIDPS